LQTNDLFHGELIIMATFSNEPIKLIVGLGNPGATYDKTRHNAGAWFVEQLAEAYHSRLSPEKKFFGFIGRIVIKNQPIHLLLPTTFMNCSGQSVAAMANFYRIKPESILVVHDELDFPVGLAKLKHSGGHGGHNGLRDIINKMGNNNHFIRLRIGIGHPGNSKDVVNYVLKPPSKSESPRIHATIDEAIRLLPEIMEGNWNKAIQQLHAFSA